ncbi:MAG: hypothetical protein KDJ47_11680 [Hyphomicrobiaceae bacterium]|nr:hypothetical protein [Hyphomicrobiaceae bacterium]
MFRIPKSNPWPPQIDLSTVRETLAYMHDDMMRVPGFEKLRDALAVAIKEAEAAELTARTKSKALINVQFLPRRH